MAVRSLAGGLVLLVGIPLVGGAAVALGRPGGGADTCPALMERSPRGGLTIDARPAPAGPGEPGSSVAVELRWDDASFAVALLHKALVCVSVEGRPAPELSAQERAVPNAGRFEYRFRIPPGLPADADVCAVGLVSGRRPDGPFDRKQSPPACVTAGRDRDGAPTPGSGPGLAPGGGSVPGTPPGPGAGTEGAAPTVPVGSGSGPVAAPGTGAGSRDWAPPAGPGPGHATAPASGPVPDPPVPPMIDAESGPGPTPGPAGGSRRGADGAPGQLPSPGGRAGRAPGAVPPEAALATTGGPVAPLVVAAGSCLAAGWALTRASAALRPSRAERRARLSL